MSWLEQLGIRGWPGPRQIGETVGSWITYNAGLKVLSVIAAFALWFFVNAGERDTETALQVPLELRNIPEDLMQVSPRVDFVDLRVSGPSVLLSRIDRERLSVVLDVGGVRPGPATFRVLPDSLNLPRGVNVVRLTPSEITIEWARKLERTVPVRLAFSGKPRNGIRITDSKVAPESIKVYGPADEVEQIKVAETVPIDLSEAEPGLIERELSLEMPREYVSYSASLVHVQVRLEEPQETRVLSKVPIVVRNGTGQISLKPAALNITVRGPRSMIKSLELDHGAVYIDAADREPGIYKETPSLDLPPEVELVKQEPETVQLRISTEKPKGNGNR